MKNAAGGVVWDNDAYDFLKGDAPKMRAAGGGRGCADPRAEGFTEHAVSENVYAGTAMSRRSVYMYGAQLDKGPAAQIGCGLDQNISTGTIGLLEPTRYVSATGQRDRAVRRSGRRRLT
ncbi:hypothetical protein [Streptomyces sp. NPDC058272]|uniref:hypothetical protein n=1 Tax=Streptomyces sp. NPDC058272 TaxID=3346415 RepID=UPI0036E15813